MNFQSTKIIELGSCAFRQWKANHSHCKYIHGYRLVAKFYFSCHHLDEKNWVVDFGGLKLLKDKLEKQFDHTLCISADDPLLEDFKSLHNKGAVDLRVMSRGVGIERTAEFCFETADLIIRGATDGRCWVTKVEVWEHEKNSAIYEYSKHETPSEVSQNINNLNTSVGAPSPEVIEAVNTQTTTQASAPAPVGNKVTSGFSNLFSGTSWGS